MFDISLEIKYCINHDTTPKSVVCKITVGLPVGNPDQSYALNSLLFDNETVFLGETLDKKWGRYDSSISHYRRFITQQYDCDYITNPDGTITVTPASFEELAKEFSKLEQVIQKNLALKGGLPTKKEYFLPISELGNIDLSSLC